MWEGSSRGPIRRAGVVRFENVGLRYSLGPEVLRDVSFQLAPHSFQFLNGPSGAGKSSLLRMLFLALKPTRGLINLFGHDVATLSQDALATLRRRIGVVFQDFRLLDHLTTFENVALPLRVIGREESSYRSEVTELLQWVGLGDRMAALPPILSGGEKQRAAIARAVIAALTLGAVVLVRSAAGEWQSAVAREVTIQVRPSDQRDIEADVRAAVALASGTAGLAGARAYSREESASLLEPWIGSGLSLN